MKTKDESGFGRSARNAGTDESRRLEFNEKEIDMAKLSAHGRTEIYRVEKNEPDNEFAVKRTHTKVLMSDGTVLGKHSYVSTSQWSAGKRESTGWKCEGKLKMGIDQEQWLQAKLARGYFQR